jgi:molybdopterin-guanine dinucleotide biosynthesis protein B
MGYAAPLNPATLAIVGHSGAGKTTLIERLLPLLNANGMRVATIKHSHHALDFDVPGKDSWRHKQAGAAASLLVASSGIQLVADVINGQDIEQLIQRYFFDMDLVLAEGFSQASCAKIEVLRQDCNPDARCLSEQGLIALVTDVAEVDTPLPKFAMNDLASVAKFIIAWHQQMEKS